MRRKQRAAPAREKHVSEKNRAEVLADINRLEQAGDANELGGYFIQLAKWGEQPRQYETVFSRYLASPSDYLRQAAIFCLLFALQLQKPEYRAAALAMLTVEEDFDLRLWASTGLGVAYRHTKDPELLQVFFRLLEDDGEDSLLKTSFAGSILLIWGVSSREQSVRLGSRSSLKAMREEFQPELQEAKWSLLA